MTVLDYHDFGILESWFPAGPLGGLRAVNHDVTYDSDAVSSGIGAWTCSTTNFGRPLEHLIFVLKEKNKKN